jgi:uncharacterized membrane protein
MVESVRRPWLLPVVGLATLLLVVLPLVAFTTTGGTSGGMGGHMMGGMGGMWMLPMFAVWVLSLVAVLGGAAVLFASGTGSAVDADAEASRSDVERPRQSDAEEGDPLRRLRERYVEGEISDEEFEHRLETLVDSADDEAERERLLAAAERER